MVAVKRLEARRAYDDGRRELDVMKQFAIERTTAGADGLLLPDAFTRGLALRLRGLAAWLVAAARRARAASRARRALGALSDRTLKDIGLVRGQIDFVADAVARGHEVRSMVARRRRAAARA